MAKATCHLLFKQRHFISPPIWRRLRVPGACSIADLHDILQTAMGWEDEHLHALWPTISQRKTNDD